MTNESGPSVDDVREIVLDATRVLMAIAARSVATVADDVTLPQYRVLVILEAQGVQTMTQLARQLAVTPSTATRSCDRLVDAKLIRRLPRLDDRRVVCVELSAKGRRVVDRVTQRRRAQIEQVLAAMAADAQQRLARSLMEFAVAAGPIADHSWVLGWSSETDGAV
jgi:DNA-binding MarR family transcriptional regulator